MVGVVDKGFFPENHPLGPLGHHADARFVHITGRFRQLFILGKEQPGDFRCQAGRLSGPAGD